MSCEQTCTAGAAIWRLCGVLWALAGLLRASALAVAGGGRGSGDLLGGLGA